MSDTKHTNAKLVGYGYPIFPKVLDELRRVANEYGITNLACFESACKQMSEFVNLNRPYTSDGYHWFCGLYFDYGDSKIAVLLPWQTDYNAPDGKTDDRSPAIYLTGQVDVEQFISKLINAMKKFGTEEKERIAAYYKESRQRYHDFFVFMYREHDGNLAYSDQIDYEHAIEMEKTWEVNPLPADAVNYFKTEKESQGKPSNKESMG